MKLLLPSTLLIVLFFMSACHPERPNILLILVDDLGYGDISIAGNPLISTPNLDQLANTGISFSNFYVSPVCAPTRASLLTGKYHQHTGVQSVTNGYETIDPEEITLAEIVKEAGYRTAIFGKWHLGEYYPSLPGQQGFDQFLGFKTGHTDQYFNATLDTNEEPVKTKGYITDVLTDRALDFMSSQEPSPFFCYLSYNAPHTPLQVDSQYFITFLDQGLDERSSRVYGMVKNLDDNVGRMINRLAELNLTKSTIILFMSDNGPISGWQIPQEKMRFNAGLRDQKFTVYEGGIRTQCFWSWENHWPQNKTLDVVAGHIDVVPTIADVLDIKSDDKIKWDGISLLPLIRGDDEALDRFFYQKFDLATLGTTEPYPGAMVRREAWKLVNGNELYNLSEDPGETKNRANGHPGKLEELKKAYENWWHEMIKETDLRRKPVEVGYLESPSIYLQPHHGLVIGNLKFEGKRGLTGELLGFHPRGVDGDWVVNWVQKGDRISWDITVVRTGVFEIGILGSGWNAQSLNQISLLLDDDFIEITDHLDDNPAADHSNILLNTVTIEEGIHQIGLQVKGSLPDPNVKLVSLSLKRLSK